MLKLLFHVSVLHVHTPAQTHTYTVTPWLLDTQESAFCEGPCNHLTSTDLQSYKYKNKHIGTLGKYSYINIIKTQNRTSMCRFMKVLNVQEYKRLSIVQGKGGKKDLLLK